MTEKPTYGALAQRVDRLEKENARLRAHENAARASAAKHSSAVESVTASLRRKEKELERAKADLELREKGRTAIFMNDEDSMMALNRQRPERPECGIKPHPSSETVFP